MHKQAALDQLEDLMHGPLDRPEGEIALRFAIRRILPWLSRENLLGIAQSLFAIANEQFAEEREDGEGNGDGENK